MMALGSLQFASFTLDLDRLCLSGPCGRARLRPKSFEVLRYLVHHVGKVVGKEEMIKAVWPDVTVTDESLTRCISEVRRALGDESQRIIKTIPRRGYLFDVSVSPYNVTAKIAPDKAGQPLAPHAASVAAEVAKTEVSFKEKWNALLRYRGKPFNEEKWNALLRYDEAVANAAAKVQPFGDKWVDELARVYLTLDDKQYLPNILQNIISDAKQEGDGHQSNPKPDGFQPVDRTNGILSQTLAGQELSDV